MAKKEKIQEEVVEAVETESVDQPTETVELSPEQQAIQDALNADDHIGALTALKTAEGTSDKLATIIATFLALTGALGADAPATQHALANLQSYKPEAAKKAKEPKEPKFNEVAELKKALEVGDDAVKALLNNDKVSDALKVVITTYFTLAELDGVEQAVVDNAKVALVNYGRKSGRSASAPVEAFNVESDGVVYTNLAAALRAHGFNNDTVTIGEKTGRSIDFAWRAVRGKLLKDGVGTYNGKTYTKVAVTEGAIGGTRGRQKKAEDTVEETTTEAEDYE